MNTLTRFIPILKSDKFGEWIFDAKNDGSNEHPQHMPYVHYNAFVVDFMKAVYDFYETHPEYELNHYLKVLKEKGIGPLKAVDIESQDVRTVLSMLVCCVRQERFCDGFLKANLECGVVTRCLERLVVLQSEGKIEP